MPRLLSPKGPLAWAYASGIRKGFSSGVGEMLEQLQTCIAGTLTVWSHDTGWHRTCYFVTAA